MASATNEHLHYKEKQGVYTHQVQEPMQADKLWKQISTHLY
jgi:hypothetical protein